ncbi:MAG: hypothetical protein ACO3D1_00165 [Ilumatobacteraceae bacterium]|nr:hypothetical protein [Actinomycetota bacterium]NCV97564.1 hypothetical protein [Acidimicrobiia bacterium]NCX18317.1 hypothetical protein [Acidimicrobiia bacterium]NCX32001.1 hypothetical protein [Actinomycetota bacterium]NCX60455.1 hypothetical protein [Actinomycetota bacterium]
MQFDPVETYELVRDYAKQETLDPLRGAGRWLGVGLIAGFLMSVGIVIVLVGVLRLTQDLLLYTWFVDQADGLSFVPYLVTLAIGIATSAVVWSRVSVFELNRGRR